MKKTKIATASDNQKKSNAGGQKITANLWFDNQALKQAYEQK